MTEPRYEFKFPEFVGTQAELAEKISVEVAKRLPPAFACEVATRVAGVARSQTGRKESTMSELVHVEDHMSIASIEQAREAIERIHDVETARDFSHRAAAAADYFKRAKETRHLANRATEVRIWAERRAGWILIDQGVDPDACADMARECGTSVPTIRRWMRFAKAIESLFEETLADLYKSGTDLSVTGVERRLATKRLERVERGIYLNAYGHYVVRWRDKGVSRQMVCGSSLQGARQELLYVTGQVQRKNSAAGLLKDSDYLPQIYSELRRLLDNLENARPYSKEVRTLLDEVFASLYVAEDKLGQALRVVGK